MNMKQKVVIKLSVHDEKSRSKAMMTAVGVHGVYAASFQHDKDQIEVTGEDVDVVLLTTLLRKSVKYAEVVSVSLVDEKKKEEDKKPDDAQIIVGWPQQITVHEFANPYYQEPNPVCSVM